jgi:hypothetical protein
MTINRALEIIDQTHPGEYDRETKIGWLSDLDKRAYEVQCRHDMETALDFSGYTINTDGDTEMLIASPYDEIYPVYLDMKVSLADRDYPFYNNAAVMFQGMWGDYTSYVNRTYMPNEKTALFNFKGNRDVQNS